MKPPSKDASLTIRLRRDVLEALKKAAVDEDRATGNLAAHIIARWLRLEGYLPATTARTEDDAPD